MGKDKNKIWYRSNRFIGGTAVVLLVGAFFATYQKEPKKVRLTSSMVIDQMRDSVRLSAIDWASIPMRVGTEGAAIYHRPFCPHAQQALETHGLVKRINFWTRQEVADSGREPDHVCQSGIFDCTIDPQEFLNAADTPYCGINMRRSNLILDTDGFAEIPAGYVLCDVTSYMAIWVPQEYCSGGSMIVAEQISHNIVSGSDSTPDGLFTSGNPTAALDTTFAWVFDQAFLDANPVPDNIYNYFCDAHSYFQVNGYVTVDATLTPSPIAHIIEAKDLFFAPDVLTIAVGDTVRWEWETHSIPIVMSVLNMINNGGMGDATGDASCTPSDYPFFHVCFGDDGVPSTVACQRVFDWDEDTDVDLLDFENFVAALGSGNEAWMADNWPDASFNRPQEIPLRVGTKGSDLYHKPDCPAVLNSWNTHGIEFRRDFYTWEQVDKTNRIPDTIACTANEGAPWYVSDRTAGRP